MHTIRSDIDYATAEAETTYGICGIKVWINKGEILLTFYRFKSYVILLTICMLLNESSNYVVLTTINNIKFNFYIVFVFATLLSMSFNFICSKHWVFK